MRRFVLFLLTIWLGQSLSGYSATVIHAGRLIDGKSDQIQKEMSIIVSEGKITKVVQGYIELAEGDTLIDLKNHTVMPGLMDMHTHLMSQFSKDAYTEKFFMDESDFALRSTMYARATLMAGFTTVRDLGDNGINSVALKRAIKEGWIVGPRIYTAGKSLATSGGHADPSNGLKGEYRRDADPAEGVINGPDEGRKAVRLRYKEGADLIKLTATGGVLSLATSGQSPQFTPEELEAIVSTAKDYGMAVAVHAHGAEGMKRAVLAGVDSIEHGTYMTEEIMELMKKKGTYWVPTNVAGEWVAKMSQQEGFFPEIVRPKAAAIGPLMKQTFAKGYKAGVKIAFGTDSGVSPHGENAREFLLMVEGGMPPMKAIQSATIEGARLLRIDSILGSLEPTKLADIVATEGNPIEDIRCMSQISFVMKEGQVYKKP